LLIFTALGLSVDKNKKDSILGSMIKMKDNFLGFCDQQEKGAA
jgi:hypothetical protein